MTLAMLYLPLRVPALMAAGREHGLVRDDWSADLGYLVHSLLARLFVEDAPRPFDVQLPTHDGRQLDVLAYTTADVAEMLPRGRSAADRPAAEAVDWARAAAKPMPALAVGRELGFRVRICPVVRVGKHHPAGFASGAEVDPYHGLVLRELAARGIDREDRSARAGVVAALPAREEVYRQWLEARVAPAVELRQARLTACADARLWRRGTPSEGAARSMHRHARQRGKGAVIGRREAVFEGRLQVVDAPALQALLARGVGRHRAFGFGMLLLHPPRG